MLTEADTAQAELANVGAGAPADFAAVMLPYLKAGLALRFNDH